LSDLERELEITDLNDWFYISDSMVKSNSKLINIISLFGALPLFLQVFLALLSTIYDSDECSVFIHRNNGLPSASSASHPQRGILLQTRASTSLTCKRSCELSDRRIGIASR
jgi:hypothetical protein